MSLRDDRRGQSVQVGAVLLFAVLVLAFTSYQAYVVPQQNEAVELEHNGQVRGQLQELRNAVVSTVGGGSPQSVSLQLGTEYPPRAVAVNPPPTAGSLRTAGTDDPAVNVTIANATAAGETGDLWNGTARTYDTGAVVYEPDYNRYERAPVTTYEHTVLYDAHPHATRPATDQTLVAGETLSIVTVDGSLSETAAGTRSVDVRPISSSDRTVRVRAAASDRPVTIRFTSGLPASEWRSLLAPQNRVRSVTSRPVSPDGRYHRVAVALETGVGYRLRMAKVGVGAGASGTSAAYLTDVAGEGATVARGGSRTVTVAARDGYNNPVAGVPVAAGATHGAFADARKVTGADGRATFRYRADDATPTGRHLLNFTTAGSGALSARPFDAGSPDNASVAVSVVNGTGGSTGDAGAYAVQWRDPDATAGNGGDRVTCSGDTCTWDVGASDDDVLALAAALSPAYDGIELDFAVSNATVGTVSPGGAATDADGTAATDLTANAAGTVEVLVSGSADSDVVTIRVENASGA